MKKLTFIILSVLTPMLTMSANTYSLLSPDGKIKIEISAGSKVTYSVSVDGIVVLDHSPVSMDIEGGMKPGMDGKVIRETRNSVNEIQYPVIPVKSSTVREQYNELILDFKGDYSIAFRAYNDGVAYRFETEFDKDIIVRSENITYNFTSDHSLIAVRTEGFITHQEGPFIHQKLSEMDEEATCFPPVMIRIEKGPTLVITEADLYDYPGTYFRKGRGMAIQALHPRFITREKAINDRTVLAEGRGDYLAKTTGSRTFPWRVICVAEDEKDLITNQLVYLLSSPLELEDTEWIRPGKVAWDWWNANNITGVDFKSGINTDTYKHYIDFAAEYGLEYIILDEGWCDTRDHFKITPGLNLEEVVGYAEEKGVGVILWVVWKTLDDQLEESLDYFEKLGVKGIKVDFMQRDDQWMVNYYRKIARKAAEHELMVDFHGSYKPSGLRRAYPNVMTREGIMGMEHCKWSANATPRHNVTAPFIRMVAGPMDYTPGAMDNAHQSNFMARFFRPMSIGTRCHQLAMYVVFESPLQMLSDTPEHYRREHDCTVFIASVPVVWDETFALGGRAGEYVITGRRSGESFYIGAMTNEDPRDLELDLAFLPEGEYAMEIFRDGVNAEKNAEDYQRVMEKVRSGEKLSIHLAPGGGWVARISE